MNLSPGSKRTGSGSRIARQLRRIGSQSPGIEFNDPLGAIEEFQRQFLRIENFYQIAESQQTFAGIIFKLKADRNTPPSFFIRRVNALNARKPTGGVQSVDRCWMDARRHRITRKFGFEFYGGSAP